jgi:hypothetical protein
MKIKMIAGLSIATAAAVPLGATAHATKPPSFQTPSGNITCWVADNVASCEVNNQTYAPPPGDCALAQNFDWRHFVLLQGKSPELRCSRQYDLPSAMTLDYGQTYPVGVMTCDSEPSGVTCTDNSTGHFFRVAGLLPAGVMRGREHSLSSARCSANPRARAGSHPPSLGLTT